MGFAEQGLHQLTFRGPLILQFQWLQFYLKKKIITADFFRFSQYFFSSSWKNIWGRRIFPLKCPAWWPCNHHLRSKSENTQRIHQFLDNEKGRILILESIPDIFHSFVPLQGAFEKWCSRGGGGVTGRLSRLAFAGLLWMSDSAAVLMCSTEVERSQPGIVLLAPPGRVRKHWISTRQGGKGRTWNLPYLRGTAKALK